MNAHVSEMVNVSQTVHCAVFLTVVKLANRVQTWLWEKPQLQYTNKLHAFL